MFAQQPAKKLSQFEGKDVHIVRMKEVNTKFGKTHLLETAAGDQVWANSAVNRWLEQNRNESQKPFHMVVQPQRDFTTEEGNVTRYTPVVCY